MPKLERPPRFLMDGTMPRFWPPRPNRFWAALLATVRWYFARYKWRLAHIQVEGADEALAQIGPGDGILIAPNHSDEADGHVALEAGRRFGRRMYFMGAWQAFERYRGLAGRAMQAMGGFSVDREGSDRRAMRHAVEILTQGHSLLVFPEGEVYHLGRRLRPLLEGVPFMALTAQRGRNDGRVWIVPTAISYRYVEDILPKLHDTMAKLERRMLLLQPGEDASLPERIVGYGEMLLTIKEKDKLGHSREKEGDLSSRIVHLTDALLERRETEYLRPNSSSRTVPQRVRILRRPLLEIWADDSAEAEDRRKARAALDDVQLAMQLFSYPGDYVTEDPTVERMAETIQKFEEDIYWSTRPKGRRNVRVVFGEPIDMSQHSGLGRQRDVAASLTDQLTDAIQGLLDESPLASRMR